MATAESGGVSFDTPDTALAATESPAGTAFHLYDIIRRAARSARRNASVPRQFPGGVGEIGPGTSVQLQGADIGQITSRICVRRREPIIITRAIVQIDPSDVEIVRRRNERKPDPGPTQSAHSVHASKSSWPRGARPSGVRNFLTSSKVVSLDIVPEAPPAHIRQVDGMAELPSTATTDIATILASVQSVLKHVERPRRSGTGTRD